MRSSAARSAAGSRARTRRSAASAEAAATGMPVRTPRPCALAVASYDPGVLAPGEATTASGPGRGRAAREDFQRQQREAKRQPQHESTRNGPLAIGRSREHAARSSRMHRFQQARWRSRTGKRVACPCAACGACRADRARWARGSPPPRRLSMRTSVRLCDLPTCSRNAAGEAGATRAGRNSSMLAPPLSAASCRRRRARSCTRSSQASTAPQACERSACSHAQRRSSAGRGAHQQEPRELHAVRGERGRVGHVRRRDQGEPAPGAGEARGGRHDELQFADAGALDVYLGERARRPAAARKPRVELGKSRRHAGHATRAQSPPRQTAGFCRTRSRASMGTAE